MKKIEGPSSLGKMKEEEPDQTDQGSMMSSKISKMESKMQSQQTSKKESQGVKEEQEGDNMGIIKYHLNELAVFEEVDSDRSNESGSDHYSDNSV